MYGIFTYIYHNNDPNVGKYSIHGASGIYVYQEPEHHLMISSCLPVWGCPGPNGPTFEAGVVEGDRLLATSGGASVP